MSGEPINDEYEIRRGKLNALREAGVDPYPALEVKRDPIGTLRSDFDAISSSGRKVAAAGRLMVTRIHGKMAFADIRDASGIIQIQLKTDGVGEASYAEFTNRIDPGDFISVEGTLFLTNKGQQTIAVSSWKLLSKALRPLPEKWHGLKDVELRYRERELDLVSNESVRHRFIVRSKMASALRRFLDERGFLEVETPILQSIPGGANARPFVTHHNALNIDLYLRIAPELYLKRLIVGGFEKVYEVGRSFRNEGIDYAHNPEFTSIELYWAFVGKDEFVKFLEDLTVYMIRESVGSEELPYQGGNISFKLPWARMTFRESIQKACGIDIDQFRNPEALEAEVRAKKIPDVDFKGCVGIGEYYDQLYKKTARAAITQPTWIFDYPIELKPLARRSPTDPTKSASVQLIVQGAEIINAYYHELNDPEDQRARFMEQQKLREQGSEEAQFMDESFLRALEHGMPPTSGMGIGIDRLVAFITDSPNLKEVILFPTLKPE